MIKVLSTGLYTTIQDLGRFGHRASGVPLSGAMDVYSAKFANQLVNNPSATAVLEYTMLGPALQFETDCELAITGANVPLRLNNESKALNSRISVKKDDVLKIGAAKEGVRGYVAIKGGIVSEMILGSTSMYSGITKNTKLEKGDILTVGSSRSSEIFTPVNPFDFSSNSIRVLRGPEFDFLPQEIQNSLAEISFKINPQSNRMAYVLETDFQVSIPEILSAPVQPGTVQITPSGKWIVLLCDAQTTGGYGRVLQLTEKAISLLSQKRAGEQVSLGLDE